MEAVFKFSAGQWTWNIHTQNIHAHNNGANTEKTQKNNSIFQRAVCDTVEEMPQHFIQKAKNDFL